VSTHQEKSHIIGIIQKKKRKSIIKEYNMQKTVH